GSKRIATQSPRGKESSLVQEDILVRSGLDVEIRAVRATIDPHFVTTYLVHRKDRSSKEDRYATSDEYSYNLVLAGLHWVECQPAKRRGTRSSALLERRCQ